jgi:hypothetical protein
MDNDVSDTEITARLRRLDADAGSSAPAFDYEGLLGRHAARQQRSRRRIAVARGAATAVFVALVSVSAWRFDRVEQVMPQIARAETNVAQISEPPSRFVRADTYLAVAALEDHIASIDDALSDARVRGGRDDIQRLERTRAELVDSWTQVRYAEMVSANF